MPGLVKHLGPQQCDVIAVNVTAVDAAERGCREIAGGQRIAWR
ncbi:MAG TPA: hypothetical protein VF933_30340 [Streptosporangiaceae bacterium]